MKRCENIQYVMLVVLAFTLLGCPPYAVTILAPLSDAIIEAGEEITFSGSATDFQDGELSDDSLVWTSNKDGEIGEGEEFTRDDLSEGEHTITLTATNSLGEKTTVSITITIGEGTPTTTTTPPVVSTTTIEVDERLESNCYNWPEEEFSPTNNSGDVTVSLNEGDAAVDFTLKDTSGQSYTLSTLLATKPVLMVFGAFT
jgi:cytoskeletal protein RodZ